MKFTFDNHHNLRIVPRDNLVVLPPSCPHASGGAVLRYVSKDLRAAGLIRLATVATGQ